MAARIPQMYSTPRAHPQGGQQQPYAQGSNNPFASSTDSLPHHLQHNHNQQRLQDDNGSNAIGGLMLSGATPPGGPNGWADEKGPSAAANYVQVDRAELHARVKSLEAAVGGGSDDESEYAIIHQRPAHGTTAPLTPRHQPMAFPQHPPAGPPAPGPRVIHFPDPNLANGGGHPGTPSTPVRVQLPILSNAAPVSPMLAAPPRAHFAVADSERPASPSSVAAFDAIREKAATFREGDAAEIFTPFSQNARKAGPRVGNNKAGQSGNRISNRISTVDFWKRMSTMNRANVREDSDWIKSKKRSIWRNPYFVFPLLLTIVGVAAIICYVVIKVHNTTSVGNS